MLQALEAANEGLATVAADKEQPDLSTEIPVPGNAAALLSETEGELTDLKRGIETLDYKS